LPWDGQRVGPDKLVADAIRVTSHLYGRPSFRSAGLSFFLSKQHTYGNLVWLIGALHDAVSAAPHLPASGSPIPAGTVLPWGADWKPHSQRWNAA
jgi:hypothetical protein